MKKKPEKRKKNLIQLFSDSSYRLLSEFLTDSPKRDPKRNRREQEQYQKTNQTILSQLKIAALKNSLVVLQIQPEKDVLQFETVSGWLSSKTITDRSLMLKTQDDQLLMITIDRIFKMTTLAPDGEQKSISR